MVWMSPREHWGKPVAWIVQRSTGWTGGLDESKGALGWTGGLVESKGALG
jgi:hypothetical protein